jgi:DNA-binding MarR family transcriptional regulator
MVVEDVGQPLVQSWRELLSLHAKTWCQLERELTEEHQLGASEFEVLDHLAELADRADDAGDPVERTGDDHPCCRVQELTAAVHLSQSALSRLIGRLERAGLVKRTMCDADRRGIFVWLTEAGRARHAEALPTHRAVLAAMLAESMHTQPAGAQAEAEPAQSTPVPHKASKTSKPARTAEVAELAGMAEVAQPQVVTV